MYTIELNTLTTRRLLIVYLFDFTSKNKCVLLQVIINETKQKFALLLFLFICAGRYTPTHARRPRTQWSVGKIEWENCMRDQADAMLQKINIFLWN